MRVNGIVTKTTLPGKTLYWLTVNGINYKFSDNFSTFDLDRLVDKSINADVNFNNRKVLNIFK